MSERHLRRALRREIGVAPLRARADPSPAARPAPPRRHRDASDRHRLRQRFRKPAPLQRRLQRALRNEPWRAAARQKKPNRDVRDDKDGKDNRLPDLSPGICPLIFVLVVLAVLYVLAYWFLRRRLRARSEFVAPRACRLAFPPRFGLGLHNRRSLRDPPTWSQGDRRPGAAELNLSWWAGKA